MRKGIVALVFFALVGAAPMLGAQEREREQERREEAERRLQEVREQLERALEQLREAQTDDARRGLEEAMVALRAAQRGLAEGRYRVIAPGRAGVSVYSYGGGAPQVAVFGDDRPRIGVLVQTERDEETDAVGALVTAVTPGGPAEEAGIEAGDVIVEANGVSLASSGGRYQNPGEKLIDIVRELEEGDELQIVYRRDGENQTAVVSPRVMESNSFFYSFGDSAMTLWEPRIRELEMVPEVFVQPRIERLRVDPGEIVARIGLPRTWLNVELVTLDEDLGAYFGTSAGLLVIRAPVDDALGLRAGDVILAIDGREPTSPSHALRILRSYDEGERVSMEIMRNRNRTNIEFTVPERERDFDFER